MKGCMCMSEANVPRMLIQNTPVIDVDGKLWFSVLTMVGEAWLTVMQPIWVILFVGHNFYDASHCSPLT